MIFATGKRTGLTRKGEITESSTHHEPDPVVNLFDQALPHSLLKVFDGQVPEKGLKIPDAHIAELSDVFSGKANVEGFLFEPGAVAGRAGGIGSILAQKDPVMDLVTFPLHPFEEPFQTDELSLSVEKNLFLVGTKFFKRCLDGIRCLRQASQR